MAASVTYTTVNGQILHENRGGTERFYVPDPLGNTAALVDTSGNITDNWTYWPYGEMLDHGDGHGGTGTSSTPFTSFGTWGCYGDPTGGIYARARELEPQFTIWLSVDPLWPWTDAFSYVTAMPALLVDPSGFGPHHKQPPWQSASCQNAFNIADTLLQRCFDPATAYTLATILECIAYGESNCDPTSVGKLGDNGYPYGLYQLANDQMDTKNGCSLSDCESDAECNTRSAIHYMLGQFRGHMRGPTVGAKICPNFGVLICFDPKKPKPENGKTMACLRAKGIEPWLLQVPIPKPGCDL